MAQTVLATAQQRRGPFRLPGNVVGVRLSVPTCLNWGQEGVPRFKRVKRSDHQASRRSKQLKIERRAKEAARTKRALRKANREARRLPPSAG